MFSNELTLFHHHQKTIKYNFDKNLELFIIFEWKCDGYKTSGATISINNSQSAGNNIATNLQKLFSNTNFASSPCNYNLPIIGSNKLKHSTNDTALK